MCVNVDAGFVGFLNDGMMDRRSFVAVEQLATDQGDRYVGPETFLGNGIYGREKDEEPNCYCSHVLNSVFSAIVAAAKLASLFDEVSIMIFRVSILIFVLIAPSPANAQSTDIRANPERMEQRIKTLGEFGANAEGGVSRIAFSDADLAGRAYIMDLMREVGLKVRVDTAGNIIGRREGREDGLPVIMFGSHIDSVPGGGNYDGDVGVIGAIEAVQLLNEHGMTTRHPLEVVNFTDEEGGLTGSRAMVGRLSDRTLEVVSHSGMKIKDGIRNVGGDPNRLDLAERKAGELLATPGAWRATPDRGRPGPT